MFILKYQQSVYEQKIATLQGHLARLDDCYSEMEKLKANMFTFWNDENARNAAKMLDETMIRVKNEKNRATKILNNYTSTVTYVQGANDAIGSLSQDAFSALGALGGMIGE